MPTSHTATPLATSTCISARKWYRHWWAPPYMTLLCHSDLSIDPGLMYQCVRGRWRHLTAYGMISGRKFNQTFCLGVFLEWTNAKCEMKDNLSSTKNAQERSRFIHWRSLWREDPDLANNHYLSSTPFLVQARSIPWLLVSVKREICGRLCVYFMRFLKALRVH